MKHFSPLDPDRTDEASDTIIATLLPEVCRHPFAIAERTTGVLSRLESLT